MKIKGASNLGSATRVRSQLLSVKGCCWLTGPRGNSSLYSLREVLCAGSLTVLRAGCSSQEFRPRLAAALLIFQNARFVFPTCEILRVHLILSLWAHGLYSVVVSVHGCYRTDTRLHCRLLCSVSFCGAPASKVGCCAV